MKTPTTKDESLKTEQAEILKVEESLSKSMENHEEKKLELIKHDYESLIEDGEVQSHHEVVCPLPSTDVIPIVHTGPPFVLVNLKFQNLYHVSMRAKNKSARENMKKEITQQGKKRVFELMREKKRKKERKGKRVREKWFVFDVLQVTMARI